MNLSPSEYTQEQVDAFKERHRITLERLERGGTSKYWHVSGSGYRNGKKLYRAGIWVADIHKTIIVDRCESEVEAAQVADKAYLYLHGPAAIDRGRINFPQAEYCKWSKERLGVQYEEALLRFKKLEGHPRPRKNKRPPPKPKKKPRAKRVRSSSSSTAGFLAETLPDGHRLLNRKDRTEHLDKFKREVPKPQIGLQVKALFGDQWVGGIISEIKGDDTKGCQIYIHYDDGDEG